LRNGKLNPDLIVDITGIGGVSPEILSKFNPNVLVVENPKCTYDKDIFEVDDSSDRLNVGKKKGLLNTFRSSRISKTSGTMTLTIDTILDSCNEIKELDGVLYALPNLKYYEGMLFHEKDAKKFISEVNTPAITVSCLDGDLSAEIDEILLKNMGRINSYVELVR
jgi:hypothetical protein